MADKSIEQLNAAEKVYLSDLFVLQQSGTAKKLTGQVLKNWLLELAQGHGGIISIVLQSTSGLNKTYRITLADDTYFDMTVSDGKGITSVAKTGTSGLVDTYTMKFNAGSDFVFTVKNGEKGDKGDADRLYFKFASQKPTDASHNMGDVPDEWLGFYAGTTPPSGWQDYTWVRIKGDKGDKGDAAKLTSHSTTYMVSDSGTVVPSGSWVADVPNVPQGKYLWTKTVLIFNTGNPVTSYSVSRFGIDGSGAVSSVNGKNPDPTGNVSVLAEDISTSNGTSVQAALNAAVKTVNGQKPDDTGAVTIGAANIRTASGTTVEQELTGKQKKIMVSGLLKGDGSGGVSEAVAGTDYQAPVRSYTATIPASGWTGSAAPYICDMTVTGLLAVDKPIVDIIPSATYATAETQIEAYGHIYRMVAQENKIVAYATDKPAVDIPIQVKAV